MPPVAFDATAPQHDSSLFLEEAVQGQLVVGRLGRHTFDTFEILEQAGLLVARPMDVTSDDDGAGRGRNACVRTLQQFRWVHLLDDL